MMKLFLEFIRIIKFQSVYFLILLHLGNEMNYFKKYTDWNFIILKSSSIRHAIFTNSPGHVFFQMHSAQSLKYLGVPSFHETRSGQVGHSPFIPSIETTGRELAIVGYMTFGKSRPTRQGIAQVLDPALIPRNRPESQLFLSLGGKAAH